MKDDKRLEYIGWDSYFLGLAAMASFRSKDPSTQNGACIIDPETLSPLSLGYNGLPRGCSDNDFPWDRTADKVSDTKYPYVEHAERNAIYNAVRKGVSLEGSIMYLYSEKGYYPCSECARAIIQSGIKEVIMGWAIVENTDVYDWDSTKRMFKASGVKLRIIAHEEKCDTSAGELNWIDLDKKHYTAKDFSLISTKMSIISEQIEKNRIRRD